MVVNLSILKNNGFVKGAFIASVVLMANGNGVCYGMESYSDNRSNSPYLNYTQDNDKIQGLNNNYECLNILNDYKDKILSNVQNVYSQIDILYQNQTKNNHGQFCFTDTLYFLGASAVYSLLTCLITGHNSWSAPCGWCLNLLNLGFGYRERLNSFMVFNFEFSLWRGMVFLLGLFSSLFKFHNSPQLVSCFFDLSFNIYLFERLPISINLVYFIQYGLVKYLCDDDSKKIDNNNSEGGGGDRW